MRGLVTIQNCYPPTTAGATFAVSLREETEHDLSLKPA
jgi:hypothetical protein